MADIHAQITAKLDELEALASAAAANCPMPWGYLKPSMELVDLSLDPFGDMFSDAAALLIVHVASPDVVLRAVAEDREVLKRHVHNRRGAAPLDDEIWCGACGWVGGPGIAGALAEAAGVEPTPWSGERWCPDVLSLARRHGVGVPDV